MSSDLVSRQFTAEDFMTAEECAAKLKVSLHTFRRWVAHYGIPVHRNGPKSVRYVWSEILQGLDANGLNIPRKKRVATAVPQPSAPPSIPAASAPELKAQEQTP